LEAQLEALMPRLEVMAKERDKAVGSLQQARQTAESEERRRREVADRVAQHRTLQEKNQAALNSVTSMREATAATAQLDQAKRMIDEDERELAAIGQRLVEANRIAQERERIATELETAQAQARESLAADQAALEAKLVQAREERQDKANMVPRSLLSRYERIRSRKRVRGIPTARQLVRTL
jgi:predicted  nucleic acid-binding Zn-ribbon protein